MLFLLYVNDVFGVASQVIINISDYEKTFKDLKKESNNKTKLRTINFIFTYRITQSAIIKIKIMLLLVELLKFVFVFILNPAASKECWKSFWIYSFDLVKRQG